MLKSGTYKIRNLRLPDADTCSNSLDVVNGLVH